MAPPTLDIFALYASLILLTSHRPIILRLHELNKILWYLLAFAFIIFLRITTCFFNKIALLNNNAFVHFDG